jgi:hypothetical protein
MAVAETRSTSTVEGVTWVKLSGTAQEVLDQLKKANVGTSKVANILMDGTYTVAIYSMCS